MAETKKFEVLRFHEGDRTYRAGDTREARQVDVQHLIDRGVLREPKTKAETPVLNKAEPAPANKAETGARLSRKG